MKAVACCVLFAIAIVVTIALFPASNWIFKNQMDLVYRRGSAGQEANYGGNGSLMPGWIVDPATYAGFDPGEQLTHALFLPEASRTAALVDYTSRHPNDALGWAVLVRMTCMMGAFTPDAPNNGAAPRADDTTSKLVIGLDASKKGEILEPNNAYFPLMRAVFCMELNRLADMESALKTAATKPMYSSHIRDQGHAMEQALLTARGYRGEYVRTGIDASILLPDFAHIKALGRYLNRKGSLSEKRDLIQTIYTMGAGEDTGIGFLVALADIRYAIRPALPYSTSSFPNLSDAEWLALASGFDRKLAAARIAPPAPSTLITYQTLHKLVDATQTYIASLSSVTDYGSFGDSPPIGTVIKTVSPYISLVALVFAVFIGVCAWAFAHIQSDTFRAMVPHLVSLPMWVVASTLVPTCCNNGGNISLFGMAFGIAQLMLAFLWLGQRPATILSGLSTGGWILLVALSPMSMNLLWWLLVPFGIVVTLLAWFLNIERRSFIARAVGIALVALSLAGRDAATAVGGIAFLIALGLLWRNKSDETPTTSNWLTVGFTVIACATVGFVLTFVAAINGEVNHGVEAAGLIALVTSAMFVRKSVKLSQIASCSCLVVFSLMYLISSGLLVRENHQQSLVRANFLNEANNIRRIAGLQASNFGRRPGY